MNLYVDSSILLFIQKCDDCVILHGLLMWFFLLIYIYVYDLKTKLPHCEKTVLFYIFEEKCFCLDSSFLFILLLILILEVTRPCHVFYLLYKEKPRHMIKPLLLFRNVNRGYIVVKHPNY